MRRMSGRQNEQLTAIAGSWMAYLPKNAFSQFPN